MPSSDSPPGSANLTARQRAYLRGLGNPLKASLWIGKDGFTEALGQQLDIQLSSHELVKVKFQKTAETDRNELAAQLSSATGAAVVQIIGRTILLFRPNEKKPQIRLDELGGD